MEGDHDELHARARKVRVHELETCNWASQLQDCIVPKDRGRD